MKAYMPCGTDAAYQRHCIYQTPKCRPCIDAHAARCKATYRKRHGYRNTAARIIIDHLETFNPMSIQELTWLIQEGHDIKDETIRRAVHRMVKDQRLLSVKDWNGRLIVEVPDG